jgi:ADP-heptose:LPS heptosyltransferase
MKEKILCIQLKQIGDVLMITPAIRALAEVKPDADIHILTQKPSDQIFQHNPNISKIVLHPGSNSIRDNISLIRQIRKERYTTVIDFFGQPKTAILARLSGAHTRIGFKKPGRSLFYTHSIKATQIEPYSALQKAHLLTALGIEQVKPELEFPVGLDEEAAADRILETIGWNRTKRLVSVSPVSRRDYKIWPAEKFAAVCDALVEEWDVQILFLWGPGEYQFIRDVREKMRHAALPDYDIPTISETVALLKRVNLHVGNDNGPMHFAISTSVRTVAIFGRPLPRNWTPPNQNQHLAVEFDPGCKKSCHYPKCEMECIRDVSVEAVLGKIRIKMTQTA